MGKHKQLMCEMCYKVIRGDNLLKAHMKTHMKKMEPIDVEGCRCPCYTSTPSTNIRIYWRSVVNKIREIKQVK